MEIDLGKETGEIEMNKLEAAEDWEFGKKDMANDSDSSEEFK